MSSNHCSHNMLVVVNDKPTRKSIQLMSVSECPLLKRLCQLFLISLQYISETPNEKVSFWPFFCSTSWIGQIVETLLDFFVMTLKDFGHCNVETSVALFQF